MGLREKSIPPDLEMSNFFDELCPGLTMTGAAKQSMS
jgi:hypothetical protein